MCFTWNHEINSLFGLKAEGVLQYFYGTIHAKSSETRVLKFVVFVRKRPRIEPCGTPCMI